MKHYAKRGKRLLRGSAARFLGLKSLSSGFIFFLESRSVLMRTLIMVTCWFGKWTQGIWPFSLVGRFVRANALLFETATWPAPSHRQNFSLPTDWCDRYYDLVVVGSGPGGSVSALRHVEQGKRVLLIEEGPDVATGALAHHSVDQAQVQLRDVGFQVIFGQVPVAFTQGRTVGGGSEVNSGLYHRVPEPYRSRLLAAVGCSDREWLSLESTVERALGVQKAPPSFISRYRTSAKDFVEGSTALGLVVEEVPRWRTYKPETHNGMKNTYLKEFLERGGVLVSQQTVTRLTENPDDVKVDMRSEGVTSSVRCGEVVVSAGALESVRLLKKSRLVRARVFRLGFHPMVRVLAAHSGSVNDDGHFPPYQAWDSKHEVKLGFSVSTFSYLRATYAALTGKVVDPEKLPKLLAYFASFALQDSKAFTLVLANRAFSWILWGKRDKQRIVQSETVLTEALVAGGANEIVKGEGKPTVSTVHLFGSMPIGVSNTVDDAGKVVGTSRVFVCDSSLLPVAPWVNPQGPIMVLCELVTSRKLAL